TWLYGEQNQVRPMFPPNTPQADLIKASKLFDLAERARFVEWDEPLQPLPVQDIMKAAGGPAGIFADETRVPTGGRMIQRAPNDSAWHKRGLWHDNMKIHRTGLSVEQ